MSLVQRHILEGRKKHAEHEIAQIVIALCGNSEPPSISELDNSLGLIKTQINDIFEGLL